MHSHLNVKLSNNKPLYINLQFIVKEERLPYMEILQNKYQSTLRMTLHSTLYSKAQRLLQVKHTRSLQTLQPPTTSPFRRTRETCDKLFHDRTQ